MARRAGTNWWADPSDNLGIVFMAHTPSGIRSHHQQQIKALVLRAMA